MTTNTLDTLRSASGARLRPNPFLHVGDERIYNPHTDRHLVRGEAGYEQLRELLARGLAVEALAEPVRELLAEGGYLVSEGDDAAARFRLKFVSLEAHSVCNQACYFCPVSIAPRDSYFMPTEQYEEIVGQLAAYRDTIEAVFMISYNEPTVDKRFVDQVATIRRHGLPPAVLTNGSGLTPRRVDRLIELGGLRFLSVNLSTIDRARYAAERGVDQLDLVLGHLDYAKDRPVAEEMDLVVLGTGDATHERDHEEISGRFAGSRFTVKSFVVNDRAGLLQVGMKARHPDRQLCGCDYFGSRPLQHLHVTPRGTCILCCQDYTESVVVGDLSRDSVAEVLAGPVMRQMRRWVYGLEPAPADFICRNCKYALTR